jgi:hypothetical protein
MNINNSQITSGNLFIDEVAHPNNPFSIKNNQFSFVIENTREKNYFSEKLMDCLITKTIPIYYGCENISDYFNTEGWILLNDEHFLEDLFKGLSQLDSTYYSRYFHIVNKNYEKALNIADRGKVYCRMLEPYL